jgi:hypothetical protein
MTRNENPEGYAMTQAVNDFSVAMRPMLTPRPVLRGSLF